MNFYIEVFVLAVISSVGLGVLWASVLALVFGVWCLVFGLWCLVFGSFVVYCLVFDHWSLGTLSLFLVLGLGSGSLSLALALPLSYTSGFRFSLLVFGVLPLFFWYGFWL
jgi:hypothetical protein